MSEWVTTKPGEKLSDGPALSGPHRFECPKRLTWLSYCQKCGHVRMRNAISRLVTKIGCAFERDQRYQAWRRNPSSLHGGADE